MNVAIIGGGASGLMAAIVARKNGAQVTIYESGNRIGRKILATGNGRCNMTHMNADTCNYYGEDRDFMNGVKEQFWIEETLQLFSELGLLYETEDDGKVYPYSNQASSVLDVFRMRIEEDGIAVVTDFEVQSVTKDTAGFCITSYKGDSAYADKVVIACGGKASPALGSNGSGYEILKGLGHGITELKPSLVQIKTDTEVVKKLKGIKIDGKLMLGDSSENGEILFTEYGISGPPVFSLTPRLGDEKYAFIDIMPEYTEEQIEEMLYTRIAMFPHRTLEEFFTGMINKRVGQALLKYTGISPLSRKNITLGAEEISKIAKTIKHWQFEIKGTMSWNNAMVTKGGAYTSEFNQKTLESKKVKGLYACGEILDIDGDCGGYNLQWAWSSGYVAGVNAASD